MNAEGNDPIEKVELTNRKLTSDMFLMNSQLMSIVEFISSNKEEVSQIRERFVKMFAEFDLATAAYINIRGEIMDKLNDAFINHHAILPAIVNAGENDKEADEQLGISVDNVENVQQKDEGIVIVEDPTVEERMRPRDENDNVNVIEYVPEKQSSQSIVLNDSRNEQIICENLQITREVTNSVNLLSSDLASCSVVVDQSFVGERRVRRDESSNNCSVIVPRGSREVTIRPASSTSGDVRRIRPRTDNVEPIHPHDEEDLCTFSWNELNLACMARMAFLMKIEDDRYPRRCFLDPFAAWTSTGPGTFPGNLGFKVENCPNTEVIYEWRNRGVQPYDFDRVAMADAYLPSGRKFRVPMAVISPLARSAIFGFDFLLREKVTVEWSRTTKRGRMYVRGESISVELVKGDGARPVNSDFSFDHQGFIDTHRSLFPEA